ncbi:GRAS family transcription factor family protein [Euphorbia peplus]|nr:GRAS family transcription factor family protein [Euphorbia peplus]
MTSFDEGKTLKKMYPFNQVKKPVLHLDISGTSRLATHKIMKVSRETFDRLSSQQYIDMSVVKNFFGSAQFNLSDEEIKDVELALVLIASAHKVSDKHFHDARRLLNLCDFLSSYSGNSVQRVVHYFTKGLQERIARETGMISPDTKGIKLWHPHQPTEGVDPAFLSCCMQLPCVQIAHFAAIQSVIDSFASARKVHFIDLVIRGGEHCPVLMQALANRKENPVEFLKITAVVIPETKQRIEEIGKCLTGLAESLNLPFSFRIAMVLDMKNLKKGIFEVNSDESVAVFSKYALRRIRTLPGCLESFSRFLRNLNPCVVVLVEPEANNSSPIFINRFHNSLIAFSSFFDCVEACVDQGDPKRLSLEANLLGHEIKDILAAKYEERMFIDMNIDEWRDHLTMYGMVETEVSKSSFDQGSLLLKNFAQAESCLLVRNGKSLVTGWKGTPFFSVSAWKFNHRQPKKFKCT